MEFWKLGKPEDLYLFLNSSFHVVTSAVDLTASVLTNSIPITDFLFSAYRIYFLLVKN